MTRTLSVWWEGAVVGTLQVNQHGELRFIYAPESLADPSRPAISFSLPKRPEPFKQRQCRPFFAGLLPDESQRDVIAGVLGISTRNDFAFLEALGGDVAGALSLWPEGDTPPLPDPAGAPRPLDDDELIELLNTLPTRPLLAGREGLRLSLAGAQTKLPVVLVDDRVALPAPGQPTTHILKPPLARFLHTTENEALVMTLAATVGLHVAPVAARTVAGRPYLLITRYDRRFDESGHAHRLHQGGLLSGARHSAGAEVRSRRRPHVQDQLRTASASDDGAGSRGAGAPWHQPLPVHLVRRRLAARRYS